MMLTYSERYHILMSISPGAFSQPLQDPAQQDTFTRAGLPTYDESFIGTTLEASQMRAEPVASVFMPCTACPHAIGKKYLDDSVLGSKPLPDDANGDARS